ncbi:MAG: hypothetical protein AB8H12_24055 [Lewinella sp.]
MKKRNLFLIAGVLALISFIGYMGETEPQDMFGFELNIWFHRIAWLIITIGFLGNYFKMRKLEKSSD